MREALEWQIVREKETNKDSTKRRCDAGDFCSRKGNKASDAELWGSEERRRLEGRLKIHQ